MRPQTLRNVVLATVLCAAVGDAQVMEGELRVRVRDPDGRPVAARVELSGRNPVFSARTRADEGGEAVLRRLPPGIHRLRVEQAGFAPFSETVEIRSAAPRALDVALRLDVVETRVTVEEAPPLFDPMEPAAVMTAGRERLEQTLGSTLGRRLIDVVTTMPGWLLEANAVLHPRGSEYDTQYVIDGMPLYDNRSIAFAPPFEEGEFEAVNILTGGIPAEYGRRLGGVIALDTRRTTQRGNRSEVGLQTGSFDTRLGSFSHQYGGERTVVSVGLQGGSTDRFLDPPSLENFTNRATTSGFHARLAQEVGERDRVTVYLRSNRANFLVPNDLAQQAAGQRQDRRSGETAGQIHYQHVFSAGVLGSARGMVRDLTSELWSNPLATPVHARQDRGFREGVVAGDLTVEAERHTLKFGGDYRSSNVRERFRLAEPDQLPAFDLDFNSTRRSHEVGLYVQDHFRVGGFAARLGLRFDHYDFAVQDEAFSPRAALSYYIASADLQLRASYDRVFQPPPIENLLLSSAVGLDSDDVEGALPVPVGRANFFEVGLRKPLGDVLRLDVAHYWRTFRDYVDDDVFLNTGVSFPITFAAARIQGTEVRVEMPRWGRFSGFASWSNMVGFAASPVTGGLFVEGGEAEELREGVERFPISQDQRNTVAAQIRYEARPGLWFAVGARYGSGLPVEIEDDDDDDDDEDGADERDERPAQPIPAAILAKVNLERGRVRPNFSLDFSTGWRAWRRDDRSATIQFDLRNATDRLNVINFSGLFSGTALAPTRQATLQLRFRF